jgi:hypothetical protein
MIASPQGNITPRRTAPLSTLEWRRFERIGAALALLGIFLTFFGLTWDIQWHADVGPDTFWTVPHLFVYAGSAVTGFACLTVVLLSTALREARADDIPVLGGRFRAPLGFVVAGFGAFGFLLFGTFDQWWHVIFGFDVSLSSPPHIGLILSALTSMIGAMLIYVRGRRVSAGAFSTALAINLGFTLPVLILMMWEMGQTWQFLVFPAFFLVTAMLLTASVTRNPWWVLGLTLIFTAFRWMNWFLVPEITNLYASSLGLALRDTSEGFPLMPYFMPILASVAGLTAALLLALSKARGWNAALSAAVIGALVAPVLYLDGSMISFAKDPLFIAPIVLLGALCGWLGWQLGVLMRLGNRELEAVTR